MSFLEILTLYTNLKDRCSFSLESGDGRMKIPETFKRGLYFGVNIHYLLTLIVSFLMILDQINFQVYIF